MISRYKRSLSCLIFFAFIISNSLAANTLVYCIGENGHAEIESTLDDCCRGSDCRQECAVDISELLHLWNVLRIRCHVHSLVAKGHDIPIPGTFGMKRLPIAPLVEDIVGRDSLNSHVLDYARIAIAHYDAPSICSAQISVSTTSVSSVRMLASAAGSRWS